MTIRPKFKPIQIILKKLMAIYQAANRSYKIYYDKEIAP